MSPSITLEMDWVGLPNPRHDKRAVIAVWDDVKLVNAS